MFTKGLTKCKKENSVDTQELLLTGNKGSTMLGYRKNSRGQTYYMSDQCLKIADDASAHWIFETMISMQTIPPLDTHLFQIWTLSQDERENWSLVCVDGLEEVEEEKTLLTLKIGERDFPLRRITFYMIDSAVMLKSEYYE